nr:hypothetical protein BaRGS_013359 [Batillaria attramentaria]
MTAWQRRVIERTNVLLAALGMLAQACRTARSSSATVDPGLVVADGAPQHEAGPAPGVVFHDTVVSIAVTSSSPYPNTPVGMVNAETAFIAEKHVLPANIVPVEVALRILQACLSMAHAELHTKCVTANSGFTWTASALMR